MPDSPPLICPAPRISKACESCRSRKLRCLPSDEAGVCKRCHSLGIDCKFATSSGPVVRSGGRRKEQSAVPKPSPKVTTVPASIDNEDVLNNMFQPKPPEPKANPLGMIRSIHQQIFDKILPSSPYWSSATTPLSQPTSESQKLPAGESGPSGPQPIPKLGKDDIRKYFDKFQNSQIYFPFIRLTQGITVEAMMKHHPFLLLGVLAAMSMSDVHTHQRLDAKFKRVLSEKTIERDEKSLDLLQGLLVYLAWYPIHLNPKSLQIFKFFQMAVGLTVDLKLDQHPDSFFDTVNFDSISHNSLTDPGTGASVSQAERLAYLGCYYLSTSVLLPFGRPNTLPFNQYMQFCVNATLHDDIEAQASILAKMQRLAEKATELSRLGSELGALSMDLQIEALIVELDTIQQNLSSTMASHPSIILSLDFTRQKIYSIPLPLPTCQIHPPTPQSPIHLSHCLSSVTTSITYITALPPTAHATFTLAEWNHIIETIVTLSRLCFEIPSVPAWDASTARQSANFIPLLSGLQVKMEDVVKYLSSTSPANPSNNNENRNINIPSLFSAVLTIVIQQYIERTSQEPQVDVFDLDPDQGGGIYPMKSGQCPVMNGSLKGTEYWNAMGAFKSDVSADAWMGGPGHAGAGGGNEMFDAAVLDDWYLWGTRLPEWDEGLVG